jgi:transposase
VIGPTGAVRVLVATKPVDFRKGAEGLAALVRETMNADPFSGAVYVFRAKRADRVKRSIGTARACVCLPSGLRMGSSAGPNVQDGVILLRHNFSSPGCCGIGSATGTSRDGFYERVDQACTHGSDRVRNVAFRPQGRSLWVQIV